MKGNSVDDCKIVDIRKFSDSRGYLSVIEGGLDVPFEIKRIYYLYLVPEAARGAHAHKQLQQLMVATSGSVHVTLDDGQNKKTFLLDKPWKGLLVVPGLWRTLEHFSGLRQSIVDYEKIKDGFSQKDRDRIEMVLAQSFSDLDIGLLTKRSLKWGIAVAVLRRFSWFKRLIVLLNRR